MIIDERGARSIAPRPRRRRKGGTRRRAPSFRHWLRDAAALGGLAVVLTGLLVYVALLPPTRLDFTVDGLPSGVDLRNFYDVERNATGAYRWSKPEASLSVPLAAPAEYRVTLTLADSAVARPPRPVTVSLNGADARTVQLDDTPRAHDFPFRLSPDNWRPAGPNTLRIGLQTVPLVPPDDPRPLGIIVSRVAIAPVTPPAPWQPALLVPNLLLLGVAYAALRAGGLRLAAAVGALGLLLAAFATFAAAARPAALSLVLQPGLHPFRVLGALALLGALPAGLAFLRGGGGVRPLVDAFRRDSSQRADVLSREGGAARSDLRRDLLLVFLLALGVRLIWVCVIPPWNAPDEPAHFAYVAHLVEHGEIPDTRSLAGKPEFSIEFITIVRLTLFGEVSTIGRPTAPDLPRFPSAFDYGAARDYGAPDSERRNAGGSTATAYPPPYYLLEAIPYWLFHDAPILSRLYAARVASAIMGALSCVFGYLLAYELRRTRRWGYALGLCMSLMPMYAFATAVVNNDAGMFLCAAAVAWLAARLFAHPSSRPAGTLGALGLVSGLGLLMKPTIFPIVVVAGFIAVGRFLPLLRRPRGLSWAKLRPLGLYVAGGVVVCAPWLLYRLAMSAATRAAGGPTVDLWTLFLHLPRYSLWSYWEAQQRGGSIYLQWLFIKTAWGLFGWLEVPLPEEAYSAITFFCIVGITGFVLQFLLRPARRRPLLFALGLVLAQVVVVFLAFDYQVGFAQMGIGTGVQGRYFFPALGPFLFLLLSGWHHLLEERPLALRVAPLLMFILQIVSLATMLTRFYGIVFR